MKTKLALMGEYSGISTTINVDPRFFPTLYSKKSNEGICHVSAMIKGKELSEMKMLVAEDDKINFLIISYLLRDKVKKVDRAINGKEAIELVMSNEYDLVLMDINMPLMGGIEATTIIKKMYPDLPIIAQTAFTNPDEKINFLNAGCDDVIYKPINKRLFFEVLLKFATN
ncbi:MAG: response regulator [Prolixibacteraceae bacterium]